MSRPVTAARRRDALLLFVAVAAVLAAGLGLRDPWPADEPRFTLVAKQMVDSGQYLFPHRGIEPYSDKPPLFMWLQAAAYHLTGSWRLAFLLPSLLAALGTLALVYDLAARLHTRRAALLATGTLAATLHFAFQAKAAQIDPTVTFWITLSAYGLLRHLLCGPAWGWYALGWFAAGLGVITKGVGFLALLLLLPWAFARWRGWRALTPPRADWRWWVAPLLFPAAIALWLVPMTLAAYGGGDPAMAAYADDLLFRQTAKRYADPWHHVKPFWYFGPVILTLWLPAVLALPWAVPAWRRRLARHDARVLLPLATAALIVLFFSSSPGKRDVYILPALPLFALALAPLLPGLWRRLAAQRLVFAVAVLLAAILLGAGLAAEFGDPGFERRIAESRAIDPWPLVIAIGAFTLLAAAVLRPRRGAWVWVAFAGSLWTLYGLWGYPLLNDARSARAVMTKARELAGPETTIALIAYKEQNLLHAVPPVVEFGFLQPWHAQRTAAMAWLGEDPARRALFVLEDALGPCVVRERAQFVGRANRRDWWLVRADALVSGCVDDQTEGGYDPPERLEPDEG